MRDWPPPRSAIAAVFNARARFYDESPLHQFLARRTLEEADLVPGMTILDLASGSGLAIRGAAARLNGDGLFVAVDVAETLLQAARAHAYPVIGDSAHLPFKDKIFDLVLCVAGFAYFSDPSHVLQDIARILRPDGTLVFQIFAAGENSLHRQFRASAATVGLTLTDPDDALGSEEKCLAMLEASGFASAHIVSETWRENLPRAEEFWSGILPLYTPFFMTLTGAMLQSWRKDFLTASSLARRNGDGMERRTIFFVKASLR